MSGGQVVALRAATRAELLRPAGRCESCERAPASVVVASVLPTFEIFAVCEDCADVAPTS